MSQTHISYIALISGYKSNKTVLINLKRLVKLGWIDSEINYGCLTLKGFDLLREENEWVSRIAIPATWDSIQNIKAFVGGALFGYLHKDYWRKAKSGKRVPKTRGAAGTLFPSFNYKEYEAPVSVIGVNLLFDIPVTTASRLKNLAHQFGFIALEKNYESLKATTSEIKKSIKFNKYKKNLVFVDGEYKLQQIDTILPLFYFKKRRKLET